MDYPGLLRLAERGELPPVLLLHGPDVQLLDDALALVTRCCFPEPADAALGREVLEGGDTSVEALVDTAATLPLMTGLRLVAVRRAQALPAKHSATLAALLARGCSLLEAAPGAAAAASRAVTLGHPEIGSGDGPVDVLGVSVQ